MNKAFNNDAGYMNENQQQREVGKELMCFFKRLTPEAMTLAKQGRHRSCLFLSAVHGYAGEGGDENTDDH